MCTVMGLYLYLHPRLHALDIHLREGTTAQVEWREFIGPAVRVIHQSLSQAADETTEAAMTVSEAEWALAKEVVLNGMSEEELNQSLWAMFEAADADGSGTIDMGELRNVLAAMDIRLSESELNYLLFKLDYDQDGVLSVDEFVPMAFKMLVQVVAEMRDWEE